MSTKRFENESLLDFGFVPLESERIAHDEHEEEPYAQVSSQPAYIQHSRPSRMASACNQVPGRLRRFHVVPVMASMAWPSRANLVNVRLVAAAAAAAVKQKQREAVAAEASFATKREE